MNLTDKFNEKNLPSNSSICRMKVAIGHVYERAVHKYELDLRLISYCCVRSLSMDKSTITLTFDSSSHLLRTSDGKETLLSPQCSSLLELFIQNADKVVSREAIRQSVWRGRHVCDDNINHTVSRLRTQIRKIDKKRVWRIETIPSVGYRFVELKCDEHLATSIRSWLSHQHQRAHDMVQRLLSRN